MSDTLIIKPTFSNPTKKNNRFAASRVRPDSLPKTDAVHNIDDLYGVASRARTFALLFS